LAALACAVLWAFPGAAASAQGFGTGRGRAPTWTRTASESPSLVAARIRSLAAELAARRTEGADPAVISDLERRLAEARAQAAQAWTAGRGAWAGRGGPGPGCPWQGFCPGGWAGQGRGRGLRLRDGSGPNPYCPLKTQR